MSAPMYDPRAFRCEACNAPKGQSCNEPTSTGRRNVRWFHVIRESRAVEALQEAPASAVSLPEAHLWVTVLADELADLKAQVLTSTGGEPRLLIPTGYDEGVIVTRLDEGVINYQVRWEMWDRSGGCCAEREIYEGELFGLIEVIRGAVLARQVEIQGEDA